MASRRRWVERTPPVVKRGLGQIEPTWPRPPGVVALTTTRTGGKSTFPYNSLNLGDHVGDSPEVVARNRRRLQDEMGLPTEPLWLDQVHGTRVVRADSAETRPRADGSCAYQPGWVCAVLTADCLPVLLASKDGTSVAALHAGWRGLAAGILEEGVACMDSSPDQLVAWLGPAIGPQAFEVGDDVRQAFFESGSAADGSFRPNDRGRWLVDLYALARGCLAAAGVAEIYGGDRCTYSEAETFFSYRRDGTCGRMASLIWIRE